MTKRQHVFSTWRAGALAAVVLVVLACEVVESEPPSVESADEVLGVCGPAVSASDSVRIHFDIPSALGNYTGAIPVTFGVPFPRGELHTGKLIKLVQQSGGQDVSCRSSTA